MKVEATITMNRDKAVVWSVITNIEQFAETINGIEKIEILSKPINGLVGLKWRETRMYFGKPTSIDKWITDAVDNKYYTSTAEMDGFVFITTFSISENGGNTTLTSCHETQSKGIIARIKMLPMIFFKGMLRKAILQDLKDFKIAVENR